MIMVQFPQLSTLHCWEQQKNVKAKLKSSFCYLLLNSYKVILWRLNISPQVTSICQKK